MWGCPASASETIALRPTTSVSAPARTSVETFQRFMSTSPLAEWPRLEALRAGWAAHGAPFHFTSSAGELLPRGEGLAILHDEPSTGHIEQTFPSERAKSQRDRLARRAD